MPPITNPLTTSTSDGTPRKPATLAEQATVQGLALALGEYLATHAEAASPGLGNVVLLAVLIALPLLAAAARNALGDTLAGAAAQSSALAKLLPVLAAVVVLGGGCATPFGLGASASPRQQYVDSLSWYYIAQGVVLTHRDELSDESVALIAAADRHVAAARAVARSCAVVQPEPIPSGATCFRHDGVVVAGVRRLDAPTEIDTVLALVQRVILATREITARAALEGDDARIIAEAEPAFAAEVR